MTTTRSILMICGSLRKGSINEAVLRTASTLLPAGVTATIYKDLAELPHFNPDRDQHPLPPVVADLRAHIDAADGLLFCTPEYAGALPGSFLNLLDWTVGGTEISEMPAGWINASTNDSIGGARLAHESLRTVLEYTGADIVEGACVRIPVARAMIDSDGIVRDEEICRRIEEALAVLASR